MRLSFREKTRHKGIYKFAFQKLIIKSQFYGVPEKARLFLCVQVVDAAFLCRISYFKRLFSVSFAEAFIKIRLAAESRIRKNYLYTLRRHYKTVICVIQPQILSVNRKGLAGILSEALAEICRGISEHCGNITFKHFFLIVRPYVFDSVSENGVGILLVPSLMT